jgi:L-Ala-D/L-Glu epimerase
MQEKVAIKKIDIFKFSIPLIEPFITSFGKETDAQNVIVRISTDKGITGFGECSPFMPVNGENVDTCLLVGKYFALALRDLNALDIKTCIRVMDKIIYGNTSIKSAFDIALHDIVAQHAGVPLYRFLGGKNNKTLFTDYTVSIDEPAKMAADALKIKNKGFPAIKVKLGNDGKKDIKRIAAIRKAVGMKIPIRIDANQGWKINEAISTLQALEPFNIEYCEEPVARWKFMRLKKVKDNSPIPIMADESCGDEHDAERLIRLKACSMLNIKIGKAGGLFKAGKIVKLAEAAHMEMQVGAFMESRLGMTAFAHFALSSPMIHHYDFDTALMFTEDPVSGGIQYAENGKITMTETPGLGASIEDKVLNEYEKISI